MIFRTEIPKVYSTFVLKNEKMKGVLIVNLGTPKSPSKKDVRAYLDEFLMDKYVIDIPYLSRFLLVKGIILNTRPKHSAKAYQKIWNAKGSPLLYHSVNLVSKVKKMVDCPVELAMRYGEPSIKSGLKKLIDLNCDEVLVIPLYPQYAMSSSVTVEEKVKTEAKKLKSDVKLDFFKPFYNDKDFIKLLSEKIKRDKEQTGSEYILFSYHSLPVHHLALTGCDGKDCEIPNGLENLEERPDSLCYKYHCLQTTKGIVEYLGLKPDEYEISYQSKLGKKEWLTPSTASRLEQIAKEGQTKLMVTIPSFVADCLETVEEIGMEGRASFLRSGGETFHRVESLNSDDAWAELVAKWIKNR